MQTLDQVKLFLNELEANEKSPVISTFYHLGPPTITENDCQQVERMLSIHLPKSYRDMLISYDWQNLRLGGMRLYANIRELISRNQATVNPFCEFYRLHHLLEIGSYEADSICVNLKDYDQYEAGMIVYIDHEEYPSPVIEFVSTNLENLLVCAAIDLRIKKQKNYYNWSQERSLEEEELYVQITKQVENIEPRASLSSFWYRFIRGF